MFATWQAPFALLAKWQSEKLGECQLVFVAISGDVDGDFVPRNITARCTMKVVPPARNCVQCKLVAHSTWAVTWSA